MGLSIVSMDGDVVLLVAPTHQAAIDHICIGGNWMNNIRSVYPNDPGDAHELVNKALTDGYLRISMI
jgi:hypothetical protein